MNYLHLLKVVADRTKIESRIAVFENAHKMRLPPVYRTFISTYETDQITKAELLTYFSEKWQKQLQMYTVTFEPDKYVSIDSIFPMEEVMIVRDKIYPKDETSLRNDYMPIGESFDQGMLLLGITDKNLDQIFLEHAHEEVRIRKVGENIFLFLQDFNISLHEPSLPAGKTVAELYRNWDEGYWRLR